MSADISRELPVDFDALTVTVRHDGQHFGLQPLLGRDTTLEAETRYGRELDLDHVQPTGRFGCEKELEPLGQSKGFIGRQVLVERTEIVGVQIVQDDTNYVCGRIGGRQSLKECGELSLGATGMNLRQSSARQWFNSRQEGAGTLFGIGVMLLAHLAALHGQWFHHITEEKTRSFVIANHWLERVVRQRVQPQDLLHLGNEPAG